jgi:CRP/FNR family transcriptional regulator, cyclic AMP receptor protein
VSRQTGTLCDLPNDTLRELYAFRQTALYPSRSVLFVEGETPRGLFVLCTGKAKASATSKEGKRVTLRLVEPGEPIGLSNVIANSPYQVTAETMRPSQVCFLPRAEFLQFLQADADSTLRIAEHLCRELHQAWEQTDGSTENSNGQSGAGDSLRTTHTNPALTRYKCKKTGHRPHL